MLMELHRILDFFYHSSRMPMQDSVRLTGFWVFCSSISLLITPYATVQTKVLHHTASVFLIAYNC